MDSGPVQTGEGGGCVATDDPGPECTDCNGNPVSPICENGVFQCPAYGCPAQGCDGTTPTCGLDCSGNPVNAYCENDVWQCQTFECPDAGCADSTPISCPVSPGGCVPFWTPECIENAWTCVETTPDCPDASMDDASDDASDDAPSPPPFACGTVGCDPTTTYCQVTTGGPVLEDGGGNGYFYCPPLPSSCTPGAAATCACVQTDDGIGCGCVESGGEVTVTCVIQ